LNLEIRLLIRVVLEITALNVAPRPTASVIDHLRLASC